MRAAFAQRAARLRSNSQRSNTLHTAPPPKNSGDFDTEYAALAAAILYQSPLPSPSGLPLYILNAAALPDSFEVDYDSLLPYVLDRFPNEDDLIAGKEYEVVFFAGGQPDNITGDKKTGPGLGWYLQVYQVLSRALRKRLQKIWIVHERNWVRMLTEVFGTIVSPKFKRKVVHVSTLSHLAMHIPIENLLIPPAVYLYDRKLAPDIYVPYATGRRAFAANDPLPLCQDGERRLPRVLRETTAFLMKGNNIQTEGLFRIPPRLQLLNVLRESYDRGQRYIVWGEGQAVYSEPLTPRTTLQEVPKPDMYGVHLAAGLIKVWYRELRVPIFPVSSYTGVMSSYDSSHAELSLDDLVTLLSPRSESSLLPYTSRIILTWHLIPLLSKIVSHEDSNKMNPDNLAICFVPALVRGGDQIQEAKMMSLLRRLIARATTLWTRGLREACDSSDESFYRRLAPPGSSQDYEDPPGDMNPPGELSDIHVRVGRVDDSPTSPERAPALPPRNDPHVQPDTSPRPKRKAAPASARRPSAPTPGTPSATTFAASEPAQHSDTESPAISGRNGARPKNIQLRPPSEMDAEKSSTALGVVTPGSEPISPWMIPVLAEMQNVQLRSVSAESSKSNDDGIFIKPTWAASSRQTSASSAVSTRKATPPLVVTKPSDGRVDSAIMSSYNPKPRTPSPGLLMRMQSWEKEAAESSSGSRTNSVSGRKQSVDDLRKLYEERATTIASMPPMARTVSGASSRSQS